MLFLLLINVKMSSIFYILTFMSRKKSCSAELSMKFFITSGSEASFIKILVGLLVVLGLTAL